MVLLTHESHWQLLISSPFSRRIPTNRGRKGQYPGPSKLAARHLRLGRARQIKVKGGEISHFESEGLVFKDGSKVAADVIFFATGYVWIESLRYRLFIELCSVGLSTRAKVCGLSLAMISISAILSGE
jgi:hypothetical protein